MPSGSSFLLSNVLFPARFTFLRRCYTFLGYTRTYQSFIWGTPLLLVVTRISPGTVISIASVFFQSIENDLI